MNFKLAIPFLLLLLVSFILTVPHNFLSFGGFTPFYTFIIIYYWFLFFPKTLPVLSVFIIGIFQDIMFGFPLGLNALFLVTYWLIVGYYKRFLFNKPFNVIWIGFVLSLLYVVLLQSFILCKFFYYSLPQLLPLFFGWYFSCLLYPVMHHIFDVIVNKCKIDQLNA
jgi:rod shape-determining protein MreD